MAGRVGVVLPRPSLLGDGSAAESGDLGECEDAEFGDSGGVFAAFNTSFMKREKRSQSEVTRRELTIILR